MESVYDVCVIAITMHKECWQRLIILWNFNMGSEFFWGADTKYGCWEIQLADYVYRRYKVNLTHGMKHSKFNHLSLSHRHWKILLNPYAIFWVNVDARTHEHARQTNRPDRITLTLRAVLRRVFLRQNGNTQEHIAEIILVFLYHGNIAPCGLRGCKNGPAPFPGRMSYKGTKPGLVCLSYLSTLYYCIVVY